jgi:lysophospholipase L1-like esterase
MVKDAQIGYLYAPSQSKFRFGQQTIINQYHQRYNQITSLPPKGISRIFVIGDSITFGTTLCDQKKTITGDLEYLLGKGYQVLNVSAGGWAPENEKQYMERFGIFGAKWVILEIGSNDLTQEFTPSSVIDSDPAMPSKKPFCAISELWFRYLWPRYFEPHLFYFLTKNPNNDRQQINYDILFERNFNSIFSMIKLAQKAGAKIIILHVPECYEMGGPKPSTLPPYTHYHVRFLNRCRTLKILTINFCNLWGNKKDISTYYRDDGIHLSEKGNFEIAREIYTVLPALSENPSQIKFFNPEF